MMSNESTAHCEIDQLSLSGWVRTVHICPADRKAGNALTL